MSNTFPTWSALNEERVALIVKKVRGGGLTADESDRLRLLQNLTRALTMLEFQPDMAKLDELELKLGWVKYRSKLSDEELAELLQHALSHWLFIKEQDTPMLDGILQVLRENVSTIPVI